jgi:hypothetical protein
MTLTFEEICPRWDKLLDTIEQTTTAKMDKQVLNELGNFGKCAVAEAWNGFAYVAECHICYTFGVKFYTEGSDREKYDKQFRTLKDEFAEHWNTKHLGYDKQ